MMAMRSAGGMTEADRGAVREAASWATRWRDVERAIAMASETPAPANAADADQVAMVALFALVWAIRESRDFAFALVDTSRDVDVICAELVASFRHAKEAEIMRATGRPFGVPLYRHSGRWRPQGRGVFARPHWTEVVSRGDA